MGGEELKQGGHGRVRVGGELPQRHAHGGLDEFLLIIEEPGQGLGRCLVLHRGPAQCLGTGAARAELL
jgi:hypothetical protein